MHGQMQCCAEPRESLGWCNLPRLRISSERPVMTFVYLNALRRFAGLIVLSAFAAVVALSGCGGGSRAVTPVGLHGPPITTREEAAEHGRWTVLVYLDADNDLESAGIHNFNQMELAGSWKDVRIVVQMDRMDGVDPNNDHWTDTRRYLITRDTNSKVMRSVRLDAEMPLGELDMADWRTLRDFVEWGVQEFPADHYCLIIWDHGTGWEMSVRSAPPKYKYVVTDNTNGSTEMNVTDIALALEGLPIDVLAFDACFMQQLEVAYQLRNSARYLVGSAAAEPSPGFNYFSLLNGIDSSTTPEDLCRWMVQSYMNEYPPPKKGITLSALDLARIPDVASAAGAFAQALVSAPESLAASLRQCRTQALNYSTIAGGEERYSLDLLDYAAKCSRVLGTDGEAAYSILSNALVSALVAERHNKDTPAASGLAIYMPPPGRYDSNYRLLDFATDTHWDDWIVAQPR